MDFVFNLNEEAALAAEKDVSFGTLETGIYKVTVKHGAISKTKGGNNMLDLAVVTEDGHETTIYGAFCMDEKWNSGAENYGFPDWQAFAQTAGMKTGDTFQKTLKKSDDTPVTKDGKPVVLTCFKELEDKQLQMAIVKELDVYEGKEKQSNIVFATFTADGKTLAESKTGSEPKRINKLSTRLSDKQTKAHKAWKNGGGEDQETPVEDTVSDDGDLF